METVMTDLITNYLFETLTGVSLLILLICFWFGYWFGKGVGKRRLRRLSKKREGNRSANDFMIQPAKDGAMEIQLTKSAFKRIHRREEVTGLVQGQKSSMVFRILRV